MGTRTRHIWRLDSQRQYTRQIGWRTSRSGKRTQHKFRLGSDLKEAKRREQKLQELWERIETLNAGQPAAWDQLALLIAQQLARGASPVTLPPLDSETPLDYAKRVQRVQANFAFLAIAPADRAAFNVGREAAYAEPRQMLNWELDIPDFSKLPAVRLQWPLRASSIEDSGQSLHQAMRQYISWIRQEYMSEHLGRLTDNGYMKIKQIETLMERHADESLATLDLEKAEQMFSYWRKRPMKKGTNRPVAKMTAMNLIGELHRFLGWLHRSKAFDWRKPSDFEGICRTVDTLPSDHPKMFAQVKTFTLEELVLLNRYATPFQRALLLLALNCGFGRAEIATLQISEIYLRRAHDHRHQGLLGYETTNADSFIKRVRRKNRVYGEFILFPQTVEAIEWLMARRDNGATLGREGLLLLNENGEPYNKPTAKGNSNHQIPNRFANLLQRIREEGHQISALSFGKLRKTAGSLIRQLSDGETAGVFLCHGHPVATDDLLDVYTNRPFGRVFAAIRTLETHLKPVFDAAGSTPFAIRRRKCTPAEAIDQI